MTNIIVKKQLNFIVNNCDIKDRYQIDRIRYGLETLFYESIKFFTLLSLSLIFNMLIEFIIITLLMLCIRYCIGGSHANSFYKCLIYSILFYITIFNVHTLLPQLSYLNQTILLLPLLTMLVLSNPKHNRNPKSFTRKKKLLLKLTSITAIIAIFILINIYSNYKLVNCALLTLIFLSINLFLGGSKMKIKKSFASFLSVLCLCVTSVSLYGGCFLWFGEPTLPADVLENNTDN